MFVVKEYYRENDKFIGATFFSYDEQDKALAFATKIHPMNSNIYSVVMIVEYNEKGELCELSLLKKEGKLT